MKDIHNLFQINLNKVIIMIVDKKKILNKCIKRSTHFVSLVNRICLFRIMIVKLKIKYKILYKIIKYF